jgi:hypothetical protein
MAVPSAALLATPASLAIYGQSQKQLLLWSGEGLLDNARNRGDQLDRWNDESEVATIPVGRAFCDAPQVTFFG